MKKAEPLAPPFLLRCRLLYLVSPLKALHSSCGIHDAPLPGKERMTLTANLHFKHLLRGAGGEGVATGANNLGLNILGMNLILHYYEL